MSHSEETQPQLANSVDRGFSLPLHAGFGVGGPLKSAANHEHANQLPHPWPFPFGSAEYWMAEALRESMSFSGKTNPNPAVGCIIVRGENELARGGTEPWGMRHAERVAFNTFPDPSALAGATAYVTLEPCSHQGRQPPCVDLFVNSPIDHVVIARSDPFPLVSGQGIARLQAAGKEVTVGVLAAEATAINLPFLAHSLLERPVIIGKWGQSLDGHLTDFSLGSQWITGGPARSYSHWLRQKYDAVLVGAGTALADFPSLTVRDCVTTQKRNPMRIVFDPNGRCFSADTSTLDKVLRTTLSAEAPVVFLTSEKAAHQGKDTPLGRFLLAASHCQLVALNPLAHEGQSLAAQLTSTLARSEIAGFLGRPLQSVMVEGGPRLLRALLAENLLDYHHIFIAPLILGGPVGRIGAEAGMALRSCERFQTIAVNPVGNDIVWETVSAALWAKISRIS